MGLRRASQPAPRAHPHRCPASGCPPAPPATRRHDRHGPAAASPRAPTAAPGAARGSPDRGSRAPGPSGARRRRNSGRTRRPPPRLARRAGRSRAPRRARRPRPRRRCPRRSRRRRTSGERAPPQAAVAMDVMPRSRPARDVRELGQEPVDLGGGVVVGQPDAEHALGLEPQPLDQARRVEVAPPRRDPRVPERASTPPPAVTPVERQRPRSACAPRTARDRRCPTAAAPGSPPARRAAGRTARIS